VSEEANKKLPAKNMPLQLLALHRPIPRATIHSGQTDRRTTSWCQ